MVPTGTPPAVVERLNAEIVKALKSPDVRERLALQGAEPLGSTPQEYGAYVKKELARWAGVVKATERDARLKEKRMKFLLSFAATGAGAGLHVRHGSCGRTGLPVEAHQVRRAVPAVAAAPTPRRAISAASSPNSPVNRWWSRTSRAANGFIAVKAVLGAPADGYTVFVGSNSTLAVNAALFKSLPYEPRRRPRTPLTMMMN